VLRLEFVLWQAGSLSCTHHRGGFIFLLLFNIINLNILFFKNGPSDRPKPGISQRRFEVTKVSTEKKKRDPHGCVVTSIQIKERQGRRFNITLDDKGAKEVQVGRCIFMKASACLVKGRGVRTRKHRTKAGEKEKKNVAETYDDELDGAPTAEKRNKQ